MWRPAAYGVPGPWQEEPASPPPGSKDSRMGVAVTCAQTGPAVTRGERTGPQPRGIQYHSGRPTRPFLVRGGAVAGAVTGMCSRPLAYSISSRGVILGTPVALETSVTPPNGLLARAGDGRPLLALGRLGQAQEVDLGGCQGLERAGDLAAAASAATTAAGPAAAGALDHPGTGRLEHLMAA